MWFAMLLKQTKQLWSYKSLMFQVSFAMTNIKQTPEGVVWWDILQFIDIFAKVIVWPFRLTLSNSC